MVFKRTYSTSKSKVVKPYNKGYRDFLDGNLDNPYNKNSKEYRDWELGFNKAYFKNKEQWVGKDFTGRGQKVYSGKT